MPAATTTPDAEKAVIAALAASAAIIDVCAGRVRGEITGPYPMIRVTRAGGPTSRRLDQPLLFLDVYGDVPANRQPDEREQLMLISRTAIAALYDLERTGPTHGCDISNVRPVTAHQWLPDPTTEQGRFHNAISLTTRAPKL